MAHRAEKEEQQGEVLGLRQADQGQGLLLESSADVQAVLQVFHRKGACGEAETQGFFRQTLWGIEARGWRIVSKRPFAQCAKGLLNLWGRMPILLFGKDE